MYVWGKKGGPDPLINFWINLVKSDFDKHTQSRLAYKGHDHVVNLDKSGTLDGFIGSL